jgi:uncharacterized membrane protein YciS (DUF1049 family)
MPIDSGSSGMSNHVRIPIAQPGFDYSVLISILMAPVFASGYLVAGAGWLELRVLMF